MCLNPILIKNKNYRHTKENSFDVRSFMKDTTSQFIEVGCGHCIECTALKQSYLRQRASLMAHDHDVFFCTLTYKEKYLPTIDINGYTHQYADVHHIQMFIKRLRKRNIFGVDFKYIAVSEYGGKNHRPHWHLLFFVPKNGRDEFDNLNLERRLYKLIWSLWAVNLATRVTKSGRTVADNVHPLYDTLSDYRVRHRYGRTEKTFDFHYVVPSTTKNGVLDVTSYVTKYCLKFDPWVNSKQQALHLNLSPEEYNDYWFLLKPRVLISKNFGTAEHYSRYLQHGIELSIKDKSVSTFCFIDSLSGRLYPLAPILRDKFVTIDQYEQFFFSRLGYTPDNIVPLSDNYYGYAYQSRRDKCEKIKEHLINRNSFDFYELE